MNSINIFKEERERFLGRCDGIVSVSFGEEGSGRDGKRTTAREILKLELLKFFAYICEAGNVFTEGDAALLVSLFDVGLDKDQALQLLERLKAGGSLESSRFVKQPISLEIARELDTYMVSTGQTEYCAADAVTGLYEKLGQIVSEEKHSEACRRRAQQYTEFLRQCTQRKEAVGMDKYEELKTEQERFLAFLPEDADKQSAEIFLTACMLKIWGSNILYSPDYKSLLSALTGKNYTMEQIITAMGCCGEEERKLLPPAFFRQIVEKDTKDGKHETSEQVLRALNDLLVSAALINGDFTVEEAAALSGILSGLAGFAKSHGVAVSETWDHRHRITGKKEDSYLRNDGLVNAAGVKDPIVKDAAANASVTHTVESRKEEIEEAAPVAERDDEDTEEIKPAVSRPDEDSEETMESLLEELDSLVGLDNVKKDVHSLMNFIKVTRLREQRGMKVPKVSYHLVFTGNPGTGKTTVARLVAKLYYHMGILPQGQLVETDRSMLVAGYLGQTAIKTQKVIQQAMGGVLFIDEAYSLANDTQDSYGKEAIETILKAMEDHRDELVVIVAGYTDLMHQFIESNPGLSSRFSKYFEFPDYSPEELLAIFGRFCKSNGYVLKPEAAGILKEKFEVLYAARDEHFGNARTARNYFEKAINAQADRLAQQAQISDQDLADLLAEDIMAATGGTAAGEAATGGTV